MRKKKLEEISDQLEKLIRPGCGDCWKEYFSQKKSSVKEVYPLNPLNPIHVFGANKSIFDHLDDLNEWLFLLQNKALEIIKEKILIIVKSVQLKFTEENIGILVERSATSVRKEVEEEWRRAFNVLSPGSGSDLEKQFLQGLRFLKNKDYQEKILTEICLDLQRRKNKKGSLWVRLWHLLSNNRIISSVILFLLGALAQYLSSYFFH